jgi:hypothetical protein
VAPRITMSLTAGDEFEIHLNDEGRSLLIQKLQSLSEKNDHFHLAAWYDAELGLGKIAHRPSDKIVGSAKILFRTDEWDQQYYPHVLDDKN